MEKIRVEVEGGRGYDILIGYDVLNLIGQKLKALNLGNSAFIITSPNIGKFHLKPLMAGLKRAGLNNIKVGYVPDGERYKTLGSAEKLLKQIDEFGKHDAIKVFVINLSGGVIGDLGGFVASVFNRGIPYVQVPSTLLAFVDCGIGGKVGVNFNGHKNKIGAFYQPKLVYADLSLLKTLNKREMRSGMAEIVKYGVIQSPGLFDFVENNVDKIFSLDEKTINRIVMESYTIKADIVGRDEFDTRDIRVRLNFGHTIGHAIEAASKFAYRHGEAISIGMACANDIAVKLGILDKGDASRVEKLLLNIGLPVKIKKISLSEIIQHFWSDKKFINGRNKFIFAKKIGKIVIREDVNMKIVQDVIKSRFM